MVKMPPGANSQNNHLQGVELAKFNIYAIKGSVKLEWTTDNEIGNIGFAIERRLMDDEEWVQIAFLSGAGTFYEKEDYEYEDKPEATGLASYRLRQTSADGAYNYSQVMGITIKKDLSHCTLYQNFPNPFILATTISFQLPDDVTGNVVLKIVNSVNDQVRLLYDREALPGYYSIEWNSLDDEARTVVPGVYDCVLETESGFCKKKLMKLSFNPNQN